MKTKMFFANASLFVLGCLALLLTATIGYNAIMHGYHAVNLTTWGSSTLFMAVVGQAIIDWQNKQPKLSE